MDKHEFSSYLTKSQFRTILRILDIELDFQSSFFESGTYIL